MMVAERNTSPRPREFRPERLKNDSGKRIVEGMHTPTRPAGASVARRWYDGDHDDRGLRSPPGRPAVSAKGIKMKLADIDVDEIVRALGKERSKWIDVATKETRQTTDAERTTICLLAALENVFSNMASHQAFLLHEPLSAPPMASAFVSPVMRPRGSKPPRSRAGDRRLTCADCRFDRRSIYSARFFSSSSCSRKSASARLPASRAT